MDNAKKLKDIAAWLDKKKGKSDRDKAKAQFFSQKKFIEECLEANYTRKKIWEFLHENKCIDFSYMTMTKYINKYIIEKEREKPQKGPESLKEKEPEKKQSKPATGFTFNPVPKKEDLI